MCVALCTARSDVQSGLQVANDVRRKYDSAGSLTLNLVQQPTLPQLGPPSPAVHLEHCLCARCWKYPGAIIVFHGHSRGWSCCIRAITVTNLSGLMTLSTCWLQSLWTGIDWLAPWSSLGVYYIWPSGSERFWGKNWVILLCSLTTVIKWERVLLPLLNISINSVTRPIVGRPKDKMTSGSRWWRWLWLRSEQICPTRWCRPCTKGRSYSRLPLTTVPSARKEVSRLLEKLIWLYLVGEGGDFQHCSGIT